MPSPELTFPSNLMGPFSLVQSRTLDLEIVEKLEKKFGIGCPKLHVFLVKNKGGKNMDAKRRNVTRQTVFVLICTILFCF